MPRNAVIDALFCLPKKNRVAQPSDCLPFSEDLAPSMLESGVGGVLIGPGQCLHCQHQWSCTGRRNQEVLGSVERNRVLFRGLASYDSFRIGESLRWIHDTVDSGEMVGAYVLAESCVAGLDAARMYPLYGICAMLSVPVVLDFSSRERWLNHRTQVEVIAADFPQQDILLAAPHGCDATGLLRLMQRYPQVGILLPAQDLADSPALGEYLEGPGRERILFRAAPFAWPQAVSLARSLPLSDAAKHSYLVENAARIFRFSGSEEAAGVA